MSEKFGGEVPPQEHGVESKFAALQLQDYKFIDDVLAANPQFNNIEDAKELISAWDKQQRGQLTAAQQEQLKTYEAIRPTREEMAEYAGGYLYKDQAQIDEFAEKRYQYVGQVDQPEDVVALYSFLEHANIDAWRAPTYRNVNDPRKIKLDSGESYTELRSYMRSYSKDEVYPLLRRIKEFGEGADKALISAIESGKLNFSTTVIELLSDKDFLRRKLGEQFNPEKIRSGQEWYGNLEHTLAATLRRLGEIGYEFDEQELHQMADTLQAERRADEGAFSELIALIQDKDYLRGVLAKFSTLDQAKFAEYHEETCENSFPVSMEPELLPAGKEFQDFASYWGPFGSVPCEIIKKLDKQDQVKMLGNKNYRYETRLFSLSQLDDLKGVDDETLVDLLSAPYDYDDEREQDYDYGQSAMRVAVIAGGLLDNKRTVLERIAQEAEDSSVKSAATERLEQLQ